MRVPIERDRHGIEADGRPQLVDHGHHSRAILPRWTILQPERAIDEVILHVDDQERVHRFRVTRGFSFEPGAPRPLQLLGGYGSVRQVLAHLPHRHILADLQPLCRMTSRLRALCGLFYRCGSTQCAGFRVQPPELINQPEPKGTRREACIGQQYGRRASVTVMA